MQGFEHIPVMLKEAVDGLNIKKNGVYIDATVGGAGHSAEIVRRLKGGRLYCFDRDKEACSAAEDRLKGTNAVILNDNFKNIKARLGEMGVNKVDGILFDLGVSSHQLDSDSRGFSYLKNSRLDMRMGRNETDAYEVVNSYEKAKLKDIFYRYGEQRYAGSIADSIARFRAKRPIATTFDLNEAVKAGMPPKAKRAKHPCKKVYQAIRIEVNDEFGSLKEGLIGAFDILGAGKRLVVITFHSLEDRIVKQMFKGWCNGCVCPPDFPVCVCGKKPKARVVVKAKKPSDEEVKRNRRSKSATLRIIEKI